VAFIIIDDNPRKGDQIDQNFSFLKDISYDSAKSKLFFSFFLTRTLQNRLDGILKKRSGSIFPIKSSGLKIQGQAHPLR
jgi:hypothetical protein